MKVLFLGRNYGYFRNFESVVRELAARGHRVHLAVERDEAGGGQQLVGSLTAEFTNVTCGDAPSRAADDWSWIASRLRLGLDYLRYQHPLFDDAPKLRERARERTPGAFVALGDSIRRTARWTRGPASAIVRGLERAVPEDPEIRAFIERERPDVLLLTPLIDLGSSQIDYLRAAWRLRIPTALCVWSWDHLSSKALIREWPDRVFVWNEVQKREATELHGVPADRVVVTGAQCFDKWFDRQPSRDRAAFCADVGLPPAPPFLLWVCSALFHGSPPESAFVVEWIRRIRADASPRLQSVPILVRPHPSRMSEWNGVDVDALHNVVLWAGAGNPVDARSRADYFDTLYHSAVVVGLNTSAFIEASIVGRPVHTILLPEFSENQMGTVHFRYLLEAGGGLLNVASSFDEHLAQLDAALAAPSIAVRPFVRTFVRPHGLEVAATPIFASEVERMSTLRVAGESAGALEPVNRWVLGRLASLRDVRRYELWTHSEREREGITRLRGARSEKEKRAEERLAAREAERRAREAAAMARYAEKRAREESERAAKAARLIEKGRYRQAKAQAATRSAETRGARGRSARIKNLIKQKLGWV